MKKILLMLSLLVLALFVVSCAPKEGAEGEEGALAGEAVKIKSIKTPKVKPVIESCFDPDSSINPAADPDITGKEISKLKELKPSLLVKTTVVSTKGNLDDYCTDDDTIREAMCAGKEPIGGLVFKCKTIVGERYKCLDGACVIS